MKITFLGTNGWFDTATGNTTCALIEAKDCYIALDAGNGFYKVKDLVKTEKPVYLFISHLHLDHIIGLHTLPIFKLSQGIDIFLPKGGEKVLKELLKRPFSSPPLLLPTRIRLHDVTKEARFPFDLEFAKLQHPVLCYGYRFGSGGQTLSYCTDTGICNNLKRLAKNVDVLITECSMGSGDKAANLFHLTPEAAARIARDSGAKKLALCHFDPGNYPTIAARKRAEDAARAIFPETVAANDGTHIDI